MYNFAVKSVITSNEMAKPLSLSSNQDYDTKEEALEALELQYNIIEGFLNSGNLSFLEGVTSYNIVDSKIDTNNKNSDSYEVEGWYLGSDSVLYKAHYTGAIKEVV